MSMHLEGPWLSTTSSKKRKTVKFKSAEHKARYLAEQESWANVLKKYGIDKTQERQKAKTGNTWKSDTQSFRRETPHYPSLNGGKDMSPALKKANPVYTGTLIKGIATMHKSNAVPVIDQAQAEEIARMRR